MGILARLLAAVFALGLFVVTPAWQHPSKKLRTKGRTKPLPVWSNQDDPLSKIRGKFSEAMDKTNDVGKIASGAVVGGLFLGPLGAIVGAQIGSALAAKDGDKISRAKELGISVELLDLTEKFSGEYKQATENLNWVKSVAEDQKRRVAQLERLRDQFYENAKKEMLTGNESAARASLQSKIDAQTKLESASEQ